VTQLPLWQTSPSPQETPSLLGDQAVTDAVGAQVSHGFSGFVAAAWKRAPSIAHPDVHSEPVQIEPAPQTVPSAAVVQATVEVVGTHDWQGFAGFSAFAASSNPPMRQPGWQ
jgi:hypothetical protein